MAASLLAACLFFLAGMAQAQGLRMPGVPGDGGVTPALGSGDEEPRYIRTAAGGGAGTKKAAREAREEADFMIYTELPGPERQFERRSEQEFFDKIRAEAKRKPGAPKVFFPDEAPVSSEVYSGRNFSRSVCLAEPGYVCHGRLYFEQKNFERYGWDFGIFTPVMEVGKYYYDLALLPYHAGTDPCHRWDCSSGKCLPGDRVPFLLYPEKFSVTGLAAEASVILGGFYFIP